MGAVPGVGPVKIPWNPAKLKTLVAKLVDTAETLTNVSITKRARKANLPAVVVKEIEKDCVWDSLSKTAINESLPEVTAKWMNRTPISGEFQDEAVLITAVCSIAVGHARILSRLDELIKAANPPTDPASPKPASPAAKT